MAADVPLKAAHEPAVMSERLLTIRSLSRRFGARQALDSVELTLAAGDRVALCGPNGSGKTTLLRCVAGTLSPTEGDVRIGAHRAGTSAAARLLGVSLSQERSFHLRLSGHAQLLFFARLHRSAREAARQVSALEEELELEELARLRVDRCSTGMVQQLAFARALLGQPALLLLDEPTRSLAGPGLERLWRALERRPQLAVLLATHRDEDIARCGRRFDLVP